MISGEEWKYRNGESALFIRPGCQPASHPAIPLTEPSAGFEELIWTAEWQFSRRALPPRQRQRRMPYPAPRDSTPALRGRPPSRARRTGIPDLPAGPRPLFHRTLIAHARQPPVALQASCSGALGVAEAHNRPRLGYIGGCRAPASRHQERKRTGHGNEQASILS